MRTGYFAPWNMSPCKVSVVIDSQTKLDSSDVKGENHGRTKHDTLFNPKTDGNTVEVCFKSGNGYLFLWFFEILVKESPNRPVPTPPPQNMDQSNLLPLIP